MKSLLAILGAVLFVHAAPASAHRLDEYLQATLVSVTPDRVAVSMRLVPGVAVASSVLEGIDTNHDGALSEMEGRSYAQRVAGDISLSVDGVRVTPQIISARFASLEETTQGTGEIVLELAASLPHGTSNRRIDFENRHRSDIAVYLINALVPQDERIRITAQTRNENQSIYRLDFVEGAGVAEAARAPSLNGLGGLGDHSGLGGLGGLGDHSGLGGLGGLGGHSDHSGLSDLSDLGGLGGLSDLGDLGDLGDLSGLTGAFHLGVRHISEGADHLLFLLALLLPAPLLAFGGRWSQRASIRSALLQTLRIVTAFTVGHSLTLALAAFGVVSAPTQPLEVLIAASILVSAAHAIRPLFPGREVIVAAFFGLVHGMAFASALTGLGFHNGYRLVTLLGFNLGIEAMQLVVVAAALPSLLLLSRTGAYSVLRVGGALVAMVASAGWMAERLFNVETAVDRLARAATEHALWIAPGLLLLSALCFLFSHVRAKPVTTLHHT